MHFVHVNMRFYSLHLNYHLDRKVHNQKSEIILENSSLVLTCLQVDPPLRVGFCGSLRRRDFRGDLQNCSFPNEAFDLPQKNAVKTLTKNT